MLAVVFDAKNGTWQGGGFWALYADEVEVSGTASQIDNEFITTQAIAVRRSDGQSFCETIAGYTICPNDQAWSFNQSEYFKAGIGPVGFHSYAGYSFSGSGFFDSFSHERHVGLVASSLPGASGLVPLAPPWIKKSPMPVARSRHTATAVNGKIYVMGGEQRTETTTTVLSSVSIYDPTNDSWTSGAPMPAARVGHTSTAYGGKIYVVGGRTSLGSAMESSLWEYDPATNTWSDLSPTYTAFADHSSVIWDSYLMLFPGTNTEVWAYQVPTAQWYVGSDSPTRYRRHATGVVANNMYLVGGSYTDWSPWVGNFTAYTTNCLSYDVTTDVWSFMASMPTPRAELATAVVDGKGIAIGGNNADGPQRAVEMYDPGTDTWTVRFPLTAGLKDHTAVESNGKVYVMGGSGYWDSVATVYEYDPANEW